MVFTAIGLVVGVDALGLVDPSVTSEPVKLLAEATLAVVLFGDASRIDLRALRDEVSIPARLLGIGLPLTIVAGFGVGARPPRLADLGRGAPARGRPRADRRGARPGRRDAARACRRASARGSTSRAGSTTASACRSSSSFSRSRRREAGDDQRLSAVRLVVEEIGYGIVGGVAAGALAPRRRRRRAAAGWIDEVWLQVVPVAAAVLAYSVADAARRLGLHRGVRRRRGLRRAAPRPRRRGRLPRRGARRPARRGHVPRLRRRHARAGARRRDRGDRRSTPCSASRSSACVPVGDRDARHRRAPRRRSASSAGSGRVGWRRSSSR